MFFFFFKQKTAYEMRISDWSSDVCSSDLIHHVDRQCVGAGLHPGASLHKDRCDRGRDDDCSREEYGVREIQVDERDVPDVISDDPPHGHARHQHVMGGLIVAVDAEPTMYRHDIEDAGRGVEKGRPWPGGHGMEDREGVL